MRAWYRGCTWLAWHVALKTGQFAAYSQVARAYLGLRQVYAYISRRFWGVALPINRYSSPSNHRHYCRYTMHSAALWDTQVALWCTACIRAKEIIDETIDAQVSVFSNFSPACKLPEKRPERRVFNYPKNFYVTHARFEIYRKFIISNYSKNFYVVI